MKNLKIIIIIFFYTTISYSQDIEIKDPFAVKYKMTLNFKEIKNYDCVLSFNNEKALFEWSKIETNKKEKEEIKNEIAKGNVSIDLTDEKELFVYSDKINNKLYEKKPKLNEHFILQENLEKISWKEIDSTKTIGNFNSKLASTNFRGREYFVWYTIEIPAFWGPWKLNGLPGLILEVYDSTNEVYITVSEIKSKNQTLKKNILNDHTILTEIEWSKKKNDFRNDIKGKLLRNLPRSAKVSNFKISEKKGFEINN